MLLLHLLWHDLPKPENVLHTSLLWWNKSVTCISTEQIMSPLTWKQKAVLGKPMIARGTSEITGYPQRFVWLAPRPCVAPCREGWRGRAKSLVRVRPHSCSHLFLFWFLARSAQEAAMCAPHRRAARASESDLILHALRQVRPTSVVCAAGGRFHERYAHKHTQILTHTPTHTLHVTPQRWSALLRSKPSAPRWLWYWCLSQ